MQRGRALPVVRAAGVHLAVVVDNAAAGEVSLRYRARGLPAGVAVSVIGAVGLAALVVTARHRRG